MIINLYANISHHHHCRDTPHRRTRSKFENALLRQRYSAESILRRMGLKQPARAIYGQILFWLNHLARPSGIHRVNPRKGSKGIGFWPAQINPDHQINRPHTHPPCYSQLSRPHTRGLHARLQIRYRCQYWFLSSRPSHRWVYRPSLPRSAQVDGRPKRQVEHGEILWCRVCRSSLWP